MNKLHDDIGTPLDTDQLHAEIRDSLRKLRNLSIDISDMVAISSDLGQLLANRANHGNTKQAQELNNDIQLVIAHLSGDVIFALNRILHKYKRRKSKRGKHKAPKEGGE